MAFFTFNDVCEPFPKQKEIFDYVLTPEPGRIKPVNLCCGLGFGKTVVAVQIAALTLNYDGNQRGLFLEPDWDRVKDIFIPKWEDIVPPELYKIHHGKSLIEWYNGSTLSFKPRVISGSKARSRNKFRGIEYSFVIDDETAIEFDLEQYQNTFARVRRKSDIKYYFTLSTPLVGPYSRFLGTPGHKLFTGKTSDNIYLPEGYEAQQRATMSTDQARRELDGELIALEGRIWKDVDIETPWPKGNLNTRHKQYNPDKPWYLFCDLGSATGAYLAVQQMDPIHYGQRIFEGQVWVAIADLCPSSNANAKDAFRRLKQEYGYPAAITAGKDIATTSTANGESVAYIANQTFPGVQIYPCDESVNSKRLQFDRLEYMIKSALNERRFTVAENFVEFDSESKRGLLQMFDEDVWLDESKKRQSDFLPKNKEIRVQHIRDAALMGAVEIMAPPSWQFEED